MDAFAFAIRPHAADGATEVVPMVDGVELTDRIHAFELERGMETRAVSYGGLIPSYFKFGAAPDHYLATEESFLNREGKIPVLGCECGEWGCWPLLARVIVGESAVTWTDFEQPHRPERDYSAFGPFVFDRLTYESAIADITAIWSSEASASKT